MAKKEAVTVDVQKCLFNWVNENSIQLSVCFI